MDRLDMPIDKLFNLARIEREPDFVGSSECNVWENDLYR
jgi:hypothetical protein